TRFAGSNGVRVAMRRMHRPSLSCMNTSPMRASGVASACGSPAACRSNGCSERGLAGHRGRPAKESSCRAPGARTGQAGACLLEPVIGTELREDLVVHERAELVGVVLDRLDQLVVFGEQFVVLVDERLRIGDAELLLGVLDDHRLVLLDEIRLRLDKAGVRLVAS